MSGRITDVPGILVGHAQDADAGTGCTVVLGPFRAACDVRGTATGTREIGTLSHLHLVPRADAILLTGGSAFGLAAADGVVAWIEEQGPPFGFDTRVARVPIVPAAVLFDLARARPDRRPDAAMGRRACEAAGTEVAEGRVGAGAGATVGKLRGPEHASPGGVGTAARRVAGFALGALAVVNAFGDVLDAAGRPIAGTRDDAGRLAGSDAIALDAAARFSGTAGTSTSLIVVATDAPLDRPGLEYLARAGSTALARRTSPAHTPFDGDVSFAVSTSPDAVPVEPGLLLALSAAAAAVVGVAIGRAVGSGEAG